MVASFKQFDICANRGAGRERAPFLIVLQHAVANELESRLAVPLMAADRRSSIIDRIEPRMSILGMPHVAVVAQIRALPLADFGEVMASCEGERYAILNALDFLVTGY